MRTEGTLLDLVLHTQTTRNAVPQVEKASPGIRIHIGIDNESQSKGDQV
jgi:hypothetical protein